MGEKSEVIIKLFGILDVTGEVITMWIILGVLAVISLIVKLNLNPKLVKPILCLHRGEAHALVHRKRQFDVSRTVGIIVSFYRASRNRGGGIVYKRKVHSRHNGGGIITGISRK